MKRSRRKFLTIIGLAAAGAGAIFYFGGGQPKIAELANRTIIAPVAKAIGPAPVSIVVASSTTKQKWLTVAAEAFQAKGIATSAGKPIAIELRGVLSGDSMLNILDGKLQPTVWSPGEATWVEQFKERWALKQNKPAISETCKPTIYTPMGIALWRPMAEAMGWPKKKLSLKSFIELANDPQGWARYGHPEWGRLRLGHTHPQYSNAGLLFMASAIYAITGKTGGLTSDDVYSPLVEQSLRALAQNTSKYGMITTDLFNMMARSGPQFLHAISAFEEGTVRFNIERGSELRWPFVFIFPEEGTYWSDHPYCILGGAAWVSAEQAEAAKLFRDFLLSDEWQAAAPRFYLRPLSRSVPLGDTLSLANGTDPAARPESVPPFASPDPKVSSAIIDQFLATKRKATMLVVLDVSGSMTGAKIRAATEATDTFLKRLFPKDRVGLMVFNDKITTISDIQLVSDVAETLSQRVLNLTSGGGTNLYGAACAAVARLKDERRKDAAQGDSRLYGVILLSDGADTAGAVSETRMFQTCLEQGPEGDAMRLITIAFGAESRTEILRRMAQSTGGNMFEADNGSIDATYLKISAEQ
jgi:Ca-activated chloride channel homolog